MELWVLHRVLYSAIFCQNLVASGKIDGDWVLCYLGRSQKDTRIIRGLYRPLKGCVGCILANSNMNSNQFHSTLAAS